ncbi:hypothetical protein CspeluHIS016_0107030 [Cutaneotrichosporon spelunceum]|uniref:Uncharacterized protein n=1 Tax=Cutaneotrichosporon spelunceum TaxID=1672016 RepID=A0AAD3TPD9_9TREE|nr:hypothetical protein CspeluHIS016_0107030 [Cutaneotrichosporon spelunceum]
MPATKRRHSPSPSPSRRVTDVASAASPASYALSALYPSDKIGFPSSSPVGLLPSSMPLSSPQRFAYRDAAASDTESDNGASDDEIEASLASFFPGETGPFKGKGKAVDRGLTSRIDSAPLPRRQTVAKLQATLGLGRRPRSRVASARGRIVSPTESIYVMTQGMSTLQTSPVQPDEELAVSSGLDSDRRDSSPSPVPSSPEPSDIDTPIPRTRKLAMSRLALARSRKRHAEDVRSVMDSARRRARAEAWDTHEGNTIDRTMLEKLAAQQGLKIVPMSPRSHEKALRAPGSSAGVHANTGLPDMSNKRVRTPSPPPHSTPAAIENLLTQTRKLARVMSSPTSPTPGASQASLLSDAHTLKAPKSSRNLERTVSAPMHGRVPSISPRAIDLVEDVVLASASEDTDSEHEELTPTKPKRIRLPVKRPVKLATKLLSKSKTRKRYEHDFPKANHLPVSCGPKLHNVGTSARKSELAPNIPRQRHRRLHLARRPVALRHPRRLVFYIAKDSDSEDDHCKEPKSVLKCRKITERVRRGLLQRYNQRIMATLPTSAPVVAMTTTPTHKRQASETPDPDDLAVDELLSDTEMQDSEAVETAISLASPSQLAGRKRRNMPADGSSGRNSQRTILRAMELSWYEPEYRKHEAWRRQLRDPARAGERRRVRDMNHIAAKEAAEQATEASRREEEAEIWIDDVLVADAEMDAAEPMVPVEPIEPAIHTAVGMDVTPAIDAAPLSHVRPIIEVALAADFALGDPADLALQVAESETNLRTASEVVEGLLLFEPPGRVQVIEEESQPSIIRDSQTLAPRRRRRRVHEHTGASTGARSGAGPALRDRILSHQRRRATTAPPEESVTEPIAGPSTETLPAAPAGPSTSSAVEGLRSPPPRYEFPFYEIVRTPVRAVRPPPPRSTGRQWDRVVSDPPDYTGPYEERSPPPPPPYNSFTDRDTVIAPVFNEPAPRTATPPHPRRGPNPDLRRQHGGDNGRHAPGTWPAHRGSPSPSLSAEDHDMGGPEPQPALSTIGSVFNRLFGFWRY